VNKSALRLLLGVFLCLFSAAPASLLAQELFSEDAISEIRVEGNQRIEPATIVQYMEISPGDRFDPIKIDQALKKLFATGLFADVNLSREGNILVVRVAENPIINRLAFEGNRRIDDETLQAEVQLRPRVVYTATKVQNDAKRILDIYRRSGRFAATVEPKVIPLDQNRVDLVFEINEGEVTEVRRIDFVGNDNFSDSTLRGEILTTESAWYRFFATDDTYDPDRITVDRESLRNFYLDEGYVDFRVISSVAELSPSRDAFFITFTVEEGERYRFGKIDINSTLKDLDTGVLSDDVETSQGDWYDQSKVDETVVALTERISDLGYAFVQVEPVPSKDEVNRTVGIIYQIREGPRVYVERIDIQGNVRTLDEVIRREFRLVEGDAFNSSKLRRTRQRIQNLGFFNKVEMQTLQGSAPDRTIVNVEVEEQSTGELSFGAGFSTGEGPLGDISIRERNLLGRGQDLRLAFTISGRRQQLDFSFTEPYFLDKNLAAGIDLFNLRIDRSEESSFDQKTLGGSLRFGWEWSEFLRQNVKYTLSQDDIFNVEPTANIGIQQQQGETISSVVGNDLTYDRRDNRINPTEGYIIRLRNDLAGLGGDVHYLRTRVSGGYYIPISDSITGSISGEAGYIFGFNEDIRITDAFFLGGSSLRGFRSAGVGPRDVATKDALGGNKYAAGTVEILFPLGLPEEYGIKGRLFSDFGTLFDTDVKDTIPPNTIVDEAYEIRVSAGFGITWQSPFGPLAVDFALPIIAKDYDREELFRFSVGTRF
jgi:outer membrane protein insertion porin family